MSESRTNLPDTVLRFARQAGASYCDIRIGRDQSEFVYAREEKLQTFSSRYLLDLVSVCFSTGVGASPAARL